MFHASGQPIPFRIRLQLLPFDVADMLLLVEVGVL